MIHLKHWNEVTNAHLPSLNSSMNELMSNVLDVNGAAIDASAEDSARPTFASLRAAQSLAPSPHMPTIELLYNRTEMTNCDLCSGFILAYTIVFLNNY